MELMPWTKWNVHNIVARTVPTPLSLSTYSICIYIYIFSICFRIYLYPPRFVDGNLFYIYKGHNEHGR